MGSSSDLEEDVRHNETKPESPMDSSHRKLREHLKRLDTMSHIFRAEIKAAWKHAAGEPAEPSEPAQPAAPPRRTGRKRGIVYKMVLAVLVDDGGTMTEGEVLAEFASRAKRHRRWGVPEATIRGALRNLVEDGDVSRGADGVGFCLEE